MKLWYNTTGELDEARQEAQREVERMNAELPAYINGDVKLRMAWRKELSPLPAEIWQVNRRPGDVSSGPFL